MAYQEGIRKVVQLPVLSSVVKQSLSKYSSKSSLKLSKCIRPRHLLREGVPVSNDAIGEKPCSGVNFTSVDFYSKPMSPGPRIVVDVPKHRWLNGTVSMEYLPTLHKISSKHAPLHREQVQGLQAFSILFFSPILGHVGSKVSGRTPVFSCLVHSWCSIPQKHIPGWVEYVL